MGGKGRNGRRAEKENAGITTTNEIINASEKLKVGNKRIGKNNSLERGTLTDDEKRRKARRGIRRNFYCKRNHKCLGEAQGR